MQIAFLIYEGLTSLDIIGPYEALCRIEDADVRFIGKQPGEFRVDTGAFGFQVDHGLADVPRPDVFVIPGGLKGTLAAAQDEEILEWVRSAHAHTRFSTSVCTGSLILGAAGLLGGLRATTHWGAKAMLEGYGARYTEERVVRQGKIMTAAGVSSGIDMALHLIAELTDRDTARTIQLAIEYDPQPPFDVGSPSKAGPKLTQRALEELAKSM